MTQPPNSIPAAAITPLRHRLQRLRAEIPEAKDAPERHRMQVAASELEALIHRLEKNHGPTGP